MVDRLEAWLRRLDEDGLARVLAHRADAIAPPWPRRISDLARRLDNARGVVDSVRLLTKPPVQLAQAIQVLDSRGEGVPRAALAASLATTDPATTDPVTTDPATTDPVTTDPATTDKAVDAALGQLCDRALAWTEEGGADAPRVVLSATMRQLWQTPFGLGRRAAAFLEQANVEQLKDVARALGVPAVGRKQQLVDAVTDFYRDPGRMAALLRDAPPETRRILKEFAWHGPVREVTAGRRRYGYGFDPDAPESWAAERGLLWSVSWDTAEMPMEVGLGVRGPEYRLPFTPQPPEATTTPADLAAVEHEASAAATRVVDRVAALLSTAAATPVKLLKSGGGIGAREIRRLAKETGCDEAATRLHIELAVQAELLDWDGAAEGFTPTDGYDAWRAAEPAARLRSLLAAWWYLPRSPLCRVDGAYRPLLDPDQYPLPALHARQTVLRSLADLPEGTAVAGDHALAPAVQWRAPLLPPDFVAENVPAVLIEAALLGLVARNAATSLGRALADLADLAGPGGGAPGGDPPGGGAATGSGDVEDDPVLAERAAALLSAARQTALFGADLTAVVTGPPGADLAELLDRVADREAQGTASVWRFSPTSVRRWFDAGETAEALVAALGEVAEGELPQPLRYLVDDVARRHGEVGVVAVASVVCGEDPALLAEIAVHRRLTKLGLRKLAPTVLASAAPAEETLTALRAAGYSPVPRGADGVMIVQGRTPSRRAAVPTPRTEATVVLDVDGELVVLPGPPGSAGEDPRAHARRLRATRGEAPPQPSRGHLAEVIRARAPRLSARGVQTLAFQLEYGSSARIRYAADGDPARETWTIANVEIDGPVLDAWCAEATGYRRFELARITDVLG